MILATYYSIIISNIEASQILTFDLIQQHVSNKMVQLRHL